MKNLHPISVCVCSALLAVTSFAQAQSPRITPAIRPDILRLLVPWVGGQASIYGEANGSEGLICGSQIKGKDTFYPALHDERLVFIFSCGQRAHGVGFGSWRIRHVNRDEAAYPGSHTVAVGTFNYASINVAGPRIIADLRLFTLRGRTTFVSNWCTDDPTTPKNIKVNGSYGSGRGGVAVEITDDHGGVIVKGTFNRDANIRAGTGPESGVNQRLHLDKP